MNKNLKDKLMEALASKGIRMHVNSCGCCDSPYVRLEVDGVMIVGTKEEDLGPDTMNFNMFTVEEDRYV